MAGKYGLHCTARALPVEYYSLKKRVEQRFAVARRKRKSRPLTGFVELPPAPLIGPCDYILEMEDATGVKMRCQVKTTVPPDLAVLCRNFRTPTP
jgi:hypothetical protein